MYQLGKSIKKYKLTNMHKQFKIKKKLILVHLQTPMYEVLEYAKKKGRADIHQILTAF